MVLAPRNAQMLPIALLAFMLSSPALTHMNDLPHAHPSRSQSHSPASSSTPTIATTTTTTISSSSSSSSSASSLSTSSLGSAVATSRNDLFRILSLHVPKKPELPICCLKRPESDMDVDEEDLLLLLSFEEWKSRQLETATTVNKSGPAVGGGGSSSSSGVTGNGSRSAVVGVGGVNGAVGGAGVGAGQMQGSAGGGGAGAGAGTESGAGGPGQPGVVGTGPAAEGTNLTYNSASSSPPSSNNNDKRAPNQEEPPYESLSPHFRVPLTDRFNYAGTDCSARVHTAHKSAKSPSSILMSKRDRYMLSPCRPPKKEEKQFVVVELCEDVRIDTVQLANFEFFSGVFKEFTVSVAKTYTTDPEAWVSAGSYKAKNARGVQSFHPPTSLRDFYRYIRIDFHSFYGNEYYCPISLLRVYGLTHLEEWKWDMWEAESKARQNELAQAYAAQQAQAQVEQAQRAQAQIQAAQLAENLKEREMQAEKRHLEQQQRTDYMPQVAPAQSSHVAGSPSPSTVQAFASSASSSLSAADGVQIPQASSLQSSASLPATTLLDEDMQPLPSYEDLTITKGTAGDAHTQDAGSMTAIATASDVGTPSPYAQPSAQPSPPLSATAAAESARNGEPGTPGKMKVASAIKDIIASPQRNTKVAAAATANKASGGDQTGAPEARVSATVGAASEHGDASGTATVQSISSSPTVTTATSTVTATQDSTLNQPSTPALPPPPAATHAPPAQEGEYTVSGPNVGATAIVMPAPAAQQQQQQPIVITPAASQPGSSTIHAEPPLHPPPPPPPAYKNPDPQSLYKSGESIYKTIMNRLSALESNHTLYVRYVEQQTSGMREVLRRLREEVGRVEGIGRSQGVMLQKTNKEWERRHFEMQKEYGELKTRVDYLREEILIEKRLSITQLLLLLAVLVFMGLTRGSRGELVPRAGAVGQYSVAPNPAASAGAEKEQDDIGQKIEGDEAKENGHSNAESQTGNKEKVNGKLRNITNTNEATVSTTTNTTTATATTTTSRTRDHRSKRTHHQSLNAADWSRYRGGYDLAPSPYVYGYPNSMFAARGYYPSPGSGAANGMGTHTTHKGLMQSPRSKSPRTRSTRFVGGGSGGSGAGVYRMPATTLRDSKVEFPTSASNAKASSRAKENRALGSSESSITPPAPARVQAHASTMPDGLAPASTPSTAASSVSSATPATPATSTSTAASRSRSRASTTSSNTTSNTVSSCTSIRTPTGSGSGFGIAFSDGFPWKGGNELTTPTSIPGSELSKGPAASTPLLPAAGVSVPLGMQLQKSNSVHGGAPGLMARTISIGKDAMGGPLDGVTLGMGMGMGQAPASKKAHLHEVRRIPSSSGGEAKRIASVSASQKLPAVDADANMEKVVSSALAPALKNAEESLMAGEKEKAQQMVQVQAQAAKPKEVMTKDDCGQSEGEQGQDHHRYADVEASEDAQSPADYYKSHSHSVGRRRYSRDGRDSGDDDGVNEFDYENKSGDHGIAGEEEETGFGFGYDGETYGTRVRAMKAGLSRGSPRTTAARTRTRTRSSEMASYKAFAGDVFSAGMRHLSRAGDPAAYFEDEDDQSESYEYGGYGYADGEEGDYGRYQQYAAGLVSTSPRTRRMLFRSPPVPPLPLHVRPVGSPMTPTMMGVNMGMGMGMGMGVPSIVQAVPMGINLSPMRLGAMGLTPTRKRGYVRGSRTRRSFGSVGTPGKVDFGAVGDERKGGEGGESDADCWTTEGEF